MTTCLMTALTRSIPPTIAVAFMLILSVNSGLAQDDPPTCEIANGGFSIVIDTVATNIGTVVTPLGTIDLEGYKTYQLFVQCESEFDLLQAVAGDSNTPTSITTTTEFYQHPLGGATEAALNPILLPAYPLLNHDSYLSIGLQSPADPSVETATQFTEDQVVKPISIGFENGGSLIIDTFDGATWFVADAETAANCTAGSDLKVFFAQVTTDGEIDGLIRFQMYRNGIQDVDNCIRPYLPLDASNIPGCTDPAACNYSATASIDDGSCDFTSCAGCTAPAACNYDATATADDGSCDFCTCADTTINQMLAFPHDSLSSYVLEIDLVANHDTGGIAELEGMKTFRMYLRTGEAGDLVPSAYGNTSTPLDIQTTTSFFQSPVGGITPNAINPAFYSLFPALPYDSWVTIGIDQVSAGMGTGYADVSTIDDPSAPWTTNFDPGGGLPGGNILINSAAGGTWFALPNTSNVIPDADQRVLLGQFTTDGIVSGSINLQVLPETMPATAPEEDNDYRLSFPFSTEELGVMIISNYDEDICGCIADVDGDGVCDSGDGCTDLSACNYDDTEATECLTEDAIGVCGGTCTTDADGNGVCDDAENPGCTNPGACNYDPNATLSDGSCEFTSCAGCTDEFACNYDATAILNDGTCEYASCTGCTDPLAWNYDETATIDDGSCQANACGEEGVLVRAYDFYYLPADVTIGIGETVVWQNMSTGLHNVNGDVNSQTGESFGNPTPFMLMSVAGDENGVCMGTVTFTLPGVYHYDCSIGNHAALGMVGTITVGIGGCTDQSAPNWLPFADFDDGSCIYSGCTDATACNYEAGANTDDGSCLFPDAPCAACDGEGGVTILDADSDGVCDADETVGCADATACNYNDLSTLDADNTLCVYPTAACASCSGATDGTGTVVISDADGDGVCDGDEVPGCTDETACNYDATATDDNGSCQTLDALGVCGGSCVADADGDLICDDVDDCVGAYDALGVCNGDCAADADADGICDDVDDCVGTPDALGVCNGDCAADADNDGICDDVDDCVGTPDALGVCNGDCAADADADGICDDEDDCVGTPDAIGVCNGDCPEDLDGDGICDDVDDCVGILDALGVCNGDCPADADGDQICDDVDDCVGTPDALGVCNGDCPADVDGDGICDNAEIPGCTDENACNYDATATDDDGSCTQPDAIGDCDGDCPADVDQDGICDLDETPGCTDETACNYDAAATLDDGSCTELDALGECGGLCPSDMDNDGICDDDDPCVGQYDALGVCNGGCPADLDNDDICDDEDDCVGEYDVVGVCNGGCTEDLDGDLICDDVDECVGTPDALGVCNGDCPADLDGDGVCDNAEIPGCMDETACNYNPDATDDDGSCATLDVLDVCGGDCTADADNDGICDDVDACVGQYDALGECNGGCAADVDNDDICDDEDPCVGSYDAIGVCNGDCPEDLDGDGVCDNAEILGCTDEAACNYDPTATEEDGSCAEFDALNECGGDCAADADADGICDDVDDCVGTYDALGVCNGDCPEDADGDGVCDNAEIFGCTDDAACNFDATATEDDGSCTVEDAIGECGGSCPCDQNNNGICDDEELACPDFNANGVCDFDEVYGCTYADACNYAETATSDDGSCTYAEQGFDCDGNNIDAGELFYGCTYQEAINYSAAADLDNGSCVFLDVITDIGPCYFDVDNNGIVNTPDLLILLQYWEATCVD